MFYDENNLHPENEGINNETITGNETANGATNVPNRGVNEPVSGTIPSGVHHGDSAPSGEYHYTRQTNPGAAPTEHARPSGGYNANSGYGAQNNGYNASNNYGAQNSGYNASNNYGTQNGGYNASNGTRRTVPPKPNASSVPPTPPRKKSGGGGKIVALALVCSLVGGLVGAGGVYALRGVHLGGNTATVAISDHSEGGVELTSTQVHAGEAMTPAQIYKTYGDAVVCINVSTRQGTGAGTGFIIDGKEGYVLTCYHVVDGAQSISVILNDSTTYSATYVGGDKDQDCAIVKITPKDGEKLDLKSVVLGDSTKLEVGESVCTIGNALGTLANTLTSGTVSALNRSESMEDGTVMNVLQTDTSINSGNSGGPLFNSYGEVIGIVNAKRSSNAFSNTASVEGIAFAIPISDVTAVMDDLMEHGYITGRPQLGITLATITAATAQQYPDMVVGAYVRNVDEGSCSEKAGLKVGDIITSFDGKEVTSSAEVIELKRNHKAGDTVDVVVHRDGDDVQLRITLDEDPDHDNPIDDGSSDSQGQGDQGYGYSYGYGNENDGGNGRNGGSYGYGFPFSFFGW